MSTTARSEALSGWQARPVLSSAALVLVLGAGLTTDHAFSSDYSTASTVPVDCEAVAADSLDRARADLVSRAITPPSGTVDLSVQAVPVECRDELRRVDAVVEEERGKQVTWDVRIDRSRFYIVEQGPEPKLPEPDYLAEKVTRHPGQITVVSRVRNHTARVTLKIADRAAAPEENGWRLLSASDYRPDHKGVMAVSDGGYPLRGMSAGKDLRPSDLHLDPARTYRVHIYAHGRDNSAERRAAAAEAEDWPKAMWDLERYYVLFVPLAG
ncbi:hypothetical protein GCM10010277_10540 [Streptomyces longisporoflavus]|uniref:hypothetical protein n=1 Tax=Streptomyces longisporoflavus TaxID=28044 RepID=UPI00167E6B42|nr:hypothetical protein [Streptomyces longisporoflavus]GGV28424.1 hypothetical protein GCM10010277_10540 [Streptomyces longisporoflavus]